MAVKRIKKKEGEKLSPENILKVINLLEAAKPITKKEACGILNISYNTTRLQKIIEEYRHEEEVTRKRREAKRGKPATNDEIKDVVEWYLEGDTQRDISNRLYRPATFIKNIVENVGVPQRKPGQTYMDYEPLPDQCVSETFEVGELVWSSKYQAIAEIDKEYPYLCRDGISKLYQVHILEKIEDVSPFREFAQITVGGFYANQPAYELGKLTHLEKYNINIRKALTSTRSSSAEI